MSPSCKSSSLALKLDIRFVVDADQSVIDASNGEFAKTKAATKSKYYYDKLKAVVAAKIHLNSMVKDTPGLNARSLKSLSIPILIVMGTSCHVFSLSIIDKNVYLLEKVTSILYPRTYKDLTENGIAKMLDAFEIVEVSCI